MARTIQHIVTFLSLHFGLNTFTNKTGCSLKYHHQAAPGEWIRCSVAVRQSYGLQVPAESLQSQQRFKHERTWIVTLGVSCIVNLFIWNIWAGFMGAYVSQMLQGSKEGHEGTGLILLIFWALTDDRRTDYIRGSVQMAVKKKTNPQILCCHRQHTLTPTHTDKAGQAG